jgi:transcriptional regulator with XRE-family HTH domain
MKGFRTTKEIRDERLKHDPEFRAYWERTALARAVASALIGYRVEHGLTQTQLARHLGISQRQVARLEVGEHPPSVDTLRSLAGLLGKRLILAITPAGEAAGSIDVPLPEGAKVLEDIVSTDGSRLLVAAG